MATTTDNFRVSAAGEYLTAAELSIRGWQVCTSPHQPSFDIAAVKGEKFHRVQVKTAARPIVDKGKNVGRYQFACKHRGTDTPYTKQDCDIIVFVGLEHRAFFVVRFLLLLVCGMTGVYLRLILFVLAIGSSFSSRRFP